MIREPKRKKGSELVFLLLSFFLIAVFVAAIVFLVTFIVKNVRKPFSEMPPTVSFEKLNRDLLKNILPR